jgi:ribosomal protein L32
MVSMPLLRARVVSRARARSQRRRPMESTTPVVVSACPACGHLRWRGRHGVGECIPAVAVKACSLVIDQSTDTTCLAIALVSADGQQRVIEARRVWTDADMALALQAAAGTYGVPVAVERTIAAQPVQAFGQIRPDRRIKDRTDG